LAVFNCYYPHDSDQVPGSFVVYGWTDMAGQVTATLTFGGGQPISGTVIQAAPSYIVSFDNLTNTGSATLQVFLNGSVQITRTVAVVIRLLSLSHPLDGATVARKNIVAYGTSDTPLTVYVLQVQGQQPVGGSLRRPAGAVPWIVQFTNAPGANVTPATLVVLNTGADVVTPKLTIDDSFTGA
jgi:hypothetical protein